MYTIIYMKADFEPWWKFEGWESNIVSTEEFETKESFEKALYKKIEKFRLLHDYEQIKDDQYWVFWSKEEQVYCDACDDETQVYHGIIAVRPFE